MRKSIYINDPDILKKLDSVSNQSEYICQLIRADIQGNTSPRDLLEALVILCDILTEIYEKIIKNREIQG